MSRAATEPPVTKPPIEPSKAPLLPKRIKLQEKDSRPPPKLSAAGKQPANINPVPQPKPKPENKTNAQAAAAAAAAAAVAVVAVAAVAAAAAVAAVAAVEEAVAVDNELLIY